MINPKILLRLMLLSLGAAAVVGAAGVLMGGTEVVGQTVGMLVLMAVCIALLLWATRGLAEPKTRASALLGTAMIIAEFLLGLAAIWDLGRFIGVSEWSLVEIMLFLAATGFPACACLRYYSYSHARIASIAGMILCSVIFLFWIMGLNRGVWQWWEYTNSLYGIGTLVVLCMIGVGTDHWHWRWIGVACAVACYVIVVRQINLNGDSGIQITTLICVSVVVAHANVTLRCPLKPGQKWIAYGAIIAMTVTGVFVTLIEFENGYRSGGWLNGASPSPYERLASASAILATCATLALVVLSRINQKMVQGPRATSEALDVGALQVVVVCPTCQRKQTLGKAGAACPGCGLRMKVVLEEPRCQACGYSLLMISSDRCPECGASRADAPVAIA